MSQGLRRGCLYLLVNRRGGGRGGGPTAWQPVNEAQRLRWGQQLITFLARMLEEEADLNIAA